MADEALTGTPSNISAATAHEIPSLPWDLTEEEFSAPAALWFKYTGKAGENAIGFAAFTNTTNTVYRPRLFVYFGTPSSLTALTNGFPNVPHVTVPILGPLLEGTTYFLKVTNMVAGPPDQSGVVLDLKFAAEPTEGYAAGDLIINDDTSRFPLMILDPTDGHVKKAVNPFPAGERADSLNGGFFLYEDRYTYELTLYDSSFALVATVADILDHGIPTMPHISGGFASKFYVEQDWNIWSVATDGSVGAQTWTIAATGYIEGVGVSPDETILYFGDRALDSSSYTIRRWDLINNIALSDLAVISPITTVFNTRDLRIMQDGSVLAMVSPNVYRYDPSGTLLHTWNFTGPVTEVNRLALDIDPGNFWVWYYPNGNGEGTSAFRKIKASDSSTLVDFSVKEFEAGLGQSSANSTPPRFGNSNSCPLVVAVAGAATLGVSLPGTSSLTAYARARVGVLLPGTALLRGSVKSSTVYYVPPCKVCGTRTPTEYVCLTRVPYEVACMSKNPESPVCLTRVC